jgi:uroporphyrinogen III methyltransferase / synthase
MPLYETLPASDEARLEIERMLAAREIDVVLLLSGSMVDSLVDLLGKDARAKLEGVVLASIGPITTQAAERHGLEVALTAPDSTIDSLLDAIAAR